MIEEAARIHERKGKMEGGSREIDHGAPVSTPTFRTLPSCPFQIHHQAMPKVVNSSGVRYPKRYITPL